MTQRLSVLLLALCAIWFSACGPKYIAPEPMVEDLLAEAKGLYDKGDIGLAKEKFEAIRFDYPGHALIGEVQFYVGLCYFSLKEYLIAQQEFESFLREFPSDNPFADDAMYYLTRSYFEQALPARLDQATTQKALEEADAFLETFPASAFAGDVKKLKSTCTDRLAEKEFLAGRLYRRMGYPSSAIYYFRLLEKGFPDSRWLLRGRYEWTRALYKQKNYADAKAMADTCRLRLTEFQKHEQENFLRTDPHGFPYRLVHLFGFVPYETRSELKIFLDDLDKDLSGLAAKIDKKLKNLAAKKKS